MRERAVWADSTPICVLLSMQKSVAEARGLQKLFALWRLSVTMPTNNYFIKTSGKILLRLFWMEAGKSQRGKNRIWNEWKLLSRAGVGVVAANMHSCLFIGSAILGRRAMLLRFRTVHSRLWFSGCISEFGHLFTYCGRSGSNKLNGSVTDSFLLPLSDLTCRNTMALNIGSHQYPYGIESWPVFKNCKA